MAHHLTAEEVWSINDQILRKDGQTSILRDNNALESAVMRPQNVAHYEQADIIEQTAFLIIGIAQSHPFLDGNKRTAIIAGAMFLEINSYLLDVSNDDIEPGERLVALVNHQISQDEFTAWLRLHSKPQPQP